MARIKRDDTVIVTAGKCKGQTGRVLVVMPRKGLVLVEKVNLVKRQVKPTADRPGGTVEKEAPLHISNVAYWDAQAGQKIKLGWGTSDDGTKVRVNRKTGEAVAGS